MLFALFQDERDRTKEVKNAVVERDRVIECCCMFICVAIELKIDREFMSTCTRCSESPIHDSVICTCFVWYKSTSTCLTHYERTANNSSTTPIVLRWGGRFCRESNSRIIAAVRHLPSLLIVCFAWSRRRCQLSVFRIIRLLQKKRLLILFTVQPNSNSLKGLEVWGRS